MKLILLVALVLTSSFARADWELMDDNATGLYYIDKSSIRRKGNTVKMWSMVRLKFERKIPGWKSFSYSKTLHVFNCIDETAGALKAITYSDAGVVVETVETSQSELSMSPVAPTTVDRDLWKIACRGK